MRSKTIDAIERTTKRFVYDRKEFSENSILETIWNEREVSNKHE